MESSSSGSGDVHAHLSSQPDKGVGMSGKFDAPGQDPEREGESLRDRAAEAFEHGGELRDRLGDAAHRARRSAGRLFDAAEEKLEERTGALRAVERNPLAALGIAFALGFLLAGDSDEAESSRPALAKAKNQIKGAIMGGISAAISQQIRTFIEEQGGLGAVLATLGIPLGGHEETSSELDDEPDYG
ncbi:MAG TPA: hypothetical protein VF167_01190 [Longimicrobiaceae bacterium]